MGNLKAFAITLGGALSLAKAIEQLPKLRILASRHVRKVMHISMGLVYMSTWGNYGPQKYCKWVAAIVPLGMSLRFAVVGLGLIKEPQLVASASRSGNPKELLSGPFMYGLVHTLCTVLWWRESPAALMALAALCVGDGMAEVVGLAVGKHTPALPYNKNKSMAGSLACALGSFLGSLPLVAFFNSRTFTTQLTTSAMVQGCGACALVAALVESLPVKEIDNVLVPLAVGLFAAYSRAFS